jgi:peptidoglycan hydrolase-like amidase
LEKIENFEIFVFVLSSHGEEKEEKLLRTDEQGSIQHYFFTKDGQWNTQDLMNEIANLEKLENKLKIFIIQVNLICFSLFSKQKHTMYGISLSNISIKTNFKQLRRVELKVVQYSEGDYILCMASRYFCLLFTNVTLLCFVSHSNDIMTK